jgi:hypothetical protein
MKLRLLLVPLFFVGCYEDKAKENPTTCEVKEVEEGLFFRCVDKEGKESSGVVENGKPGEVGPQGPRGEGLKVEKTVSCSGVMEGWMAGSSYAIKYNLYKFETGSVFVASNVDLKRGDEVISSSEASAFYVSQMAVLENGPFSMELKSSQLHLTKKSGETSTIPCVEK